MNADSRNRARILSEEVLFDKGILVGKGETSANYYMVSYLSSHQMTVDKEKIENILRSDDFGVNHLRDIVDEHELPVSKSESEPMIEALLATEWTESQEEDLIERFEEIQLEKSPWGYYVGTITEYPRKTDQPLHIELKQQLRRNPVDRDDEEVYEPGFEIRDTTEKRLTGIYWTKTNTFQLNALRELEERRRTYDMGIEMDLEDDIILINTDNYGKLNELLKELTIAGLEIEPVEHKRLLHDASLHQVRGFVEDLHEGLRSEKSQTSLAEYGANGDFRQELLEIDVVRIRLETELKRVNIEGHEDIFENDVVKELTENEKGRIVHLKGEFEYGEEDFNFHVGYTEKLGRIRIQKKGLAKRDVDIVEEAFDFLYGYYENHFIHIDD